MRRRKRSSGVGHAAPHQRRTTRCSRGGWRPTSPGSNDANTDSGSVLVPSPNSAPALSFLATTVHHTFCCQYYFSIYIMTTLFINFAQISEDMTSFCICTIFLFHIFTFLSSVEQFFTTILDYMTGDVYPTTNQCFFF